MIYIERILEFKRNDVKIRRSDSKTEEPIILYKGDRNIELQFIIENNPFSYKSGVEITYGQLIIKRPNANPIFSDVAKFSNSKASFIITGDMIDELDEIGEYDFQIRLLNADQTSRGTLPPVYAGIVIKEPVCEEDGVGYSAASYARTLSGETEDTFDDEGNYNKTVWTKGDTITDTKLNKIEDALYEINDSSITDSDLDNKGYLTEHQDVSHLALKSELPTNVSGLVNDAGYVSESYVDNVTFGLRSEMNLQLENYASKEEIPSIEGLATETYVNEAISNIEIPEGNGGNVDLSNYYTETEIDGLLSGKSDLSHNHDTMYYRKFLVDAKINALSIDSYAKLEDLTTWANQFALKNHTHDEYLKDADFSNYATKDDIGNIDAILDNINGEEI